LNPAFGRRSIASSLHQETAMCEEWWDERLLKEQAEKLKRSSTPAMPAKPQEERKPERKPQNQPDPVPV
jgi:hypothetical protein